MNINSDLLQKMNSKGYHIKLTNTIDGVIMDLIYSS